MKKFLRYELPILVITAAILFYIYDQQWLFWEREWSNINISKQVKGWMFISTILCLVAFGVAYMQYCYDLLIRLGGIKEAKQISYFFCGAFTFIWLTTLLTYTDRYNHRLSVIAVCGLHALIMGLVYVFILLAKKFHAGIKSF